MALNWGNLELPTELAALDLVLVLGFGLVYWVVGRLALVAVLLLSVLGISAKERERMDTEQDNIKRTCVVIQPWSNHDSRRFLDFRTVFNRRGGKEWTASKELY